MNKPENKKMESGNRTAEEIAEDIIDNLLCFGMSLPDRIPNRKRIVTALNVYASQQCEALQSENERLKSALSEIDAAYWVDPEPRYDKIEIILRRTKSALNPKE